MVVETSEHNGIIPIHFDVPQHSLPLKQFVNSAEALQAIVDDFNKNIFDGELQYELHIIPPEQGGLLELVELVVNNEALLAGGGIWAFLSTDIGKGFVKGLTKQEPRYFAEKLGEKIRSLFEGSPNESGEREVDQNKLAVALVAVIVSQMVIGFLEHQPEHLEKIGISKKKHRDAYVAKNIIIQGCIDNPNVAALGFDATHNFPIPRSGFAHHLATIPLKEELEIDPTWTVEITDIVVYSPNWKREGKRQWQGDTTQTKDLSFSIDDDYFWEHVRLKDIQPKIKDNMKVQWAYPAVSGKKPTNVRVLKVLTYNGMRISDPLIDEALAEVLGDFSNAPPSSQPDLFEEFTSSNKKNKEHHAQSN